MIKRNDFLALFFAMFLLGCEKKPKQEFFSNLRGAVIDIKLSSDSYFLKSFGIASTPIMISKVAYWKLQADQISYFYLEGYLKNEGDSIMILPINYGFSKGTATMFKLFDFSLNHQKSWKLFFKLDTLRSKGDSVIYLNKTIMNNDTLYHYSLTPFVFHNKTRTYNYDNEVTFNIAVSKNHGIVTISRFDPVNNSLIYQSTFYPKLKFVNNHNNLLDL